VARTRVFFVVGVCVLFLVGCTVTPRPVPTPTVNAVSVTSAASIEPPVSTFDLVCSTPSDGIKSWLAVNFTDLTDNDVTMVDVGVGMAPGSDWAVVALWRPDLSTAIDVYVDTWLTTMDGHTKWIEIGGTWQSSVSFGWVGISWTGDRLARGKEAQTMAIACVRNQLASG